MAARTVSKGAGRGRRFNPASVSPRLSKWPRDRSLNLLDGSSRAQYPDGGVHDPAEARRTLFQHIQQCADAEHATIDLARHSPPCRSSPRLSCIKGLYSAPGRIFPAAIFGDRTWYVGHHRRPDKRPQFRCTTRARGAERLSSRCKNGRKQNPSYDRSCC